MTTSKHVRNDLPPGSIAEEIVNLKAKRRSAIEDNRKARAQLLLAELDIRVLDHCIKVLSEPTRNADRRTPKRR